MGKKPFVSVLTPTFNRRKFISQYLKCLHKQDYPYRRVEILIVDDGDDPVEDLVGGVERVRYIRLEEKKPLGFKRNLLAAEARGDILVHFDDDDYYPPTRISHAVQRLMESENLLAGCNRCYYYFTSTDKIMLSLPAGRDVGIEGTFAYWKEFAANHSFEDTSTRNEAKYFTENFTVPLAKLEHWLTILAIEHDRNTVDKAGMVAVDTKVKLKDLVKGIDDRRFYRTKLGHDLSIAQK